MIDYSKSYWGTHKWYVRLFKWIKKPKDFTQLILLCILVSTVGCYLK